MKAIGAGLVGLGLLVAPAPGRGDPTEALHSLSFRIHVSLINAGAGQDLAYWQGVLDRALGDATVALQGYQGPADTACCTRIERNASLASFGSAADGFDIVTTAVELASLKSTFGSGAYIIDSLATCGGVDNSPGFAGCADTPGDFLIVDLDIEPALGLVIAHERGHNGGLLHPQNRIPPLVNPDPCLLMSASGGGGCLPSGDCTSIRAKAASLGAACQCLGDAVGDPPAADGAVCTDTAGCGLCSGGLCGACLGGAGTKLLAAAGLESDAAAVPDDLVVLSALSGGRRATLGALGAAVGGLSYDPGRDVVFGVRATAGSDELIRIDPASGAVLGVVGSTGRSDLSGLAYDPAGDRLFAIQREDAIFGSDCVGDFGLPLGCISRLLQIDPDDAAATSLGLLNTVIIEGGVQGLGYDSIHGKLYGVSAGGMVRIATICTGGINSTCATTNIANPFAVIPSSLEFDPASGLLVFVGYGLGFGAGVPLQIGVEPETGAIRSFMGVDGYTVGGLAVVPIPEAAGGVAVLFAAGALAMLRGRHALRRIGA